MPYDVFISYARASKAAEAAMLAENLAAQRVSAFYDQSEIEVGAKFPSKLADALLSSKLVLVFADETYFSKTWCNYEYKVCCAPYAESVKAGKPAESLTENILMVLPETGDIEAVTASFPVPLRQKSWPACNNMQAIVQGITSALAGITSPLSEKLKASQHEAIVTLRTGALIPMVPKPYAGACFTSFAPPSVKESFSGRADALWEIYGALELKGKEEANKCCVVQGFAGMGKSQLAAEYMWRYAPFTYKGGVIWVNAETNDQGLLEQFNKIIAAFSGTHPVPANTLAEAADHILQLFKNMQATEKILWVIDNLPGTGDSPGPKHIPDFCPVKDYVSLLITTRQHGIKNADHLITLQAFTAQVAKDYLTRLPVQKEWLEQHEWLKIVHWVGCLPLALHILHIDLADGFIAAKDLLQKAYYAESATALNEEAESLKEEMPPGYIRSMHDIMNISYERLKTEPELFSAAHIFSRLAARLVPESFIHSFISNKILAKLSKRGWLQPMQHTTDTERYWGMHRVTGSYLRAKSIEPVEENMALLKWLYSLVDGNNFTDYLGIQPHFRMISLRAVEIFHKTRNELLLRQLTDTCIKIALHDPGDYEKCGLSYLAAEIMESAGTSDELVKAYRDLLTGLPEDGIRRMIHSLSACNRNVEAARLVIACLGDNRDMVRWTVFVYLDRFLFADIGIVMLDGLMQETNVNILNNNQSSFNHLLNIQDEGLLADFISKTLNYYQNTSYPPHRELTVNCLGILMRIFGRNLQAQGYTGTHIENYLWQIAQTGPETETRTAAIEGLVFSGNQKYYDWMVAEINKAENLEELQQHTENLLAWIQILESPGAPSGCITEDEGEITGMTVKFGETGTYRPELYDPLSNVLLSVTNEEMVNYLLVTLLKHNTSKLSLANLINKGIDQKAGLDKCLQVAEKCMAMQPEFSSPYWWKARILTEQEKYAEAIYYFSEVINMTPEFADSYYYRAQLYQILGNQEAANTDWKMYQSLVDAEAK